MKEAIQVGVKSGCVVPLICHGNVLGTLAIASLRESAFSEADAELLDQIGAQVAIAVENSLNFEKLRKAEREVGLGGTVPDCCWKPACPQKGTFDEGVLIPLEGTPEGEAVRSGRPVLVARQADLARFSPLTIRMAEEYGVRSGCTVPLIAHGHIWVR
jgi:GAF domain-containing protein